MRNATALLHSFRQIRQPNGSARYFEALAIKSVAILYPGCDGCCDFRDGDGGKPDRDGGNGKVYSCRGSSRRRSSLSTQKITILRIRCMLVVSKGSPNVSSSPRVLFARYILDLKLEGMPNVTFLL